MNRLTVFISGLLLLLAEVSWAQKEVEVSYLKPYQYQTINGKVQVKARLQIAEAWQKGSVYLDGEPINITPAGSDIVECYLPLAGKEGELVFYSGGKTDKQVLSRQIFRPLVPAEWGYFGQGTVHIICSSHQDIAWMNTPDSCRHERIHDIVIPALDLIDKNPDFKFEMEQTLNLMEVLDEVPAERKRITDAFKKGQFTWGATFNQPYEGLESGEQLVRQAYLGRKWIKNNLPGMDALAAYNVDVPGRSVQFPQILEKAGIKYLFVSRMKEGFYNWYSPNGSKVLTYSPGNYGWSLLFYRYFEEDAITALQKLNKVMQNWNDYYAERKIPPHYAIVISTDAGGPKDYTPLIREWNEIARNSGLNIPSLQHSTAEEFLSLIDVPAARFDSIAGERPDLWLYIHGPAHYQAIKAKKAAAVSVPAAEIFNSVNGMIEGNFSAYPEKELNEAWYKSIYPDHGWGGKHGDITDSIFRASLEEGNAAGEKYLQRSLYDLSSKIDMKHPDNIVVFNDLSWDRTGIVTIDISDRKGQEWRVLDAKEKLVPSQIRMSGDKKLISFTAENIPSIGYRTFHLKKGGQSQTTDVSAGSNFCENRFYKMELGPGGITRLVDKETGKLVFNTTKFAGGDLLNLGYSGNGAGEFVQVTPTNMDQFETLGTKHDIWKLAGNNAVFTSFESVSRMQNFSVIQTITIYHQLKKIDLVYAIPDWPGDYNRQLRVAFPLNMEQAQVTYDVPMGIVQVGKDELARSPGGWSWGGTYRQMPEEINPREIENFISASKQDLGVTLSTNLAVVDWIDPTRESVSYPILQAVLLSSHKSCHGEGNWYHQKESHEFKISLTSHQAGWKNGYPFGVGENHPLSSVFYRQTARGNLPPEMSFLSVSSPFVRMTTLKKSDDDRSLVIRLVEMEGTDKDITLKLFSPVKSILKTNLIEESDQQTGPGGKTFQLSVGKNSIETLKLKL